MYVLHGTAYSLLPFLLHDVQCNKLQVLGIILKSVLYVFDEYTP
jgi:hypothetical protein